MDIFVNSAQIDYTIELPKTWAELIQQLLENHIPKNHGIIKILVDSADSLEVMTEKQNQYIPDTVKKLEIFSKDAHTISLEGFDKINILIEKIKSQIGTVADYYREGKINEASTSIVKVMEAIKPIINFINSVGVNFSLNFDELRFDEKQTFREKIEGFLKSFNELVDAQKKKDFVEIADFLEYQLTEDMSEWNKIVEILKGEIENFFQKEN